MFEPIVTYLVLPRVFVVEFLRRLPKKLKLGIIYSHVQEISGNSYEIDLNLSNSIILTFDYINSDTVRVKAELYDIDSKNEYIKFIEKIGYVEKEVEKVYQVFNL